MIGFTSKIMGLLAIVAASWTIGAGGVAKANAGEANLKTVARTGAGFRFLGDGPSQNDAGQLAFMARAPGASGVADGLWVWHEGKLTELVNPVFRLKQTGDAPFQSFGSSVQINNTGQVLAWRRTDAIVQELSVVFFIPVFSAPLVAPLTYLELWPAAGSNAKGKGVPDRQVAMNGHLAGGLPILTIPTNGALPIVPGLYFINPATGAVWPSAFNVNSPFAGVLGNATMNNRNQSVFSAFENDVEFLANHSFLRLRTEKSRPKLMLADTGDLVFRVGDTILLGTIANANPPNLAIGFSGVGIPGISDDGSIVVFSGDLSPARASQLSELQPASPPLTPGPGVFALVGPRSGRVWVRLAGLTGNGQLDPAETWIDRNKNGRVDSGEDVGPLAGFAANTRVCVNRSGADATDYTVAFAGTLTNGMKAVFACRVDPQAPELLVSPPAKVFATRQQINLHDAVNNKGEICFWTGSPNGAQSIIRATPGQPGPRVINVVTHGFDPFGSGSGADGDYQHDAVFFAEWTRFEEILEKIPQKGSLLEGRVDTYVSNWDSTSYFRAALATYIISELPLVDKLPPPWNEVASIALDLALEFEIEQSRECAAIAAKAIAADLENFGLEPEETREGSQIIHLIGHSRGGAVNALVADILSRQEFEIDQYTGLDAYATDWPGVSGQFGDCDVTEVLASANVRRKVNYRVQAGLIELIIAWFERQVQIWAGDSPPPDYERSIVAEIARFFADWRAPDRPGFENILLKAYGDKPVSHHMNIVELYRDSDSTPGAPPYIRDNYLGRNRAKPRTAPSPAALISETAIASPNRLARQALPALNGLSEVNFVDGGFEKLGARIAAADALAGVPSDDPLLKLWVSAARDESRLLRSFWGATGTVKLVRIDNNWKLELTKSTNTSIRPLTFLDSRNRDLRFDLDVLAAGTNDTLEVQFNGRQLAKITLRGARSGGYSFALTGMDAQGGQLSFALTGPATGTARIRLDNLNLVSPLSIALRQARIRPDGSFSMRVEVNLPGDYRVERSSDFQNWEKVADLKNIQGSVEVVDNNLGVIGQRFYRVQSLNTNAASR